MSDLKLFIVVGSHRPESESGKVGRYIQASLAQRLGPEAITLLELAKNPLPFWDESVWENTDYWKQHWGPHAKKLQECDGLVVVSPEWAGMAPPALKNFFLLCSNRELAHKPGLLIGVSSGMSGTYPVAELRLSSVKNSHLCYIPDHVIIRKVESTFNRAPGEPAANPDDDAAGKRVEYSLEILLEYARALKSVRKSTKLNLKEFANGM